MASSYFVVTNGSDSNPGTILKTLLTVPEVIRKELPGDTIYVRSGTYPEPQTLQIKKSGAKDSILTLSAYPPDLTSVYPLDGNMNGQGFILGGCDAATNGKKYQAHHFRVNNCLSAFNKSKGFDQNYNAGTIYSSIDYYVGIGIPYKKLVLQV